MRLYVIKIFETIGSSDGKHRYRPVSVGPICQSKKLAEKILNKSGYYQNTSLGSASRYFSSTNTNYYALIHLSECLEDDIDVTLADKIYTPKY